MLVISGIKKTYGAQELFCDVTFTVNQGERIGLVGRNGHGKSTLFKLILGLEEADGGEIICSKNYKIGYLSQHLNFTENTILDEVCLALPLLDGSWKETYKAEALLHGLGFHDADFTRPPGSFSGGYQIRLNLVKLLLSEPNLLLLDEPTNYLDIVSIRWLRTFLKSFSGEVLLITHDRAFMDSVTTHTVAIHRGKVRKVEGPTTKLYELIVQEEEIYEKTRVGEEKKRKQVEDYVTRFRAKASKAKSVQSKVKLLEKMEVREELSDIRGLEFNFSSVDFPGKWPLVVNDMDFAFEKGQNLIPQISFSLAKRDRIAVIGQNGKGKTTLLNLLAGELTPSHGNIRTNEHTKIGYFGQTNINRLSLKRTIEEEVWSVAPTTSRTTVRGICGAMMFEGDTALKNISILSGGERSRVLLGKLLLTPCNLLLLDEPTNHLDMHSVEALADAIDDFAGAVMFVTHSEELIERLATRLIVFDRNGVELIEGTYRDFLENRGWEDEDGSKKTPDNQNGQSLKMSSKVEKIREKETKKIEAKISKQEQMIEAISIEISQASATRDLNKLFELSKQLEKAQQELEKLFDKL